MNTVWPQTPIMLGHRQQREVGRDSHPAGELVAKSLFFLLQAPVFHVIMLPAWVSCLPGQKYPSHPSGQPPKVVPTHTSHPVLQIPGVDGLIFSFRAVAQ